MGPSPGRLRSSADMAPVTISLALLVLYCAGAFCIPAAPYVAVKPGDCPITKATCKTPLPKGNCTSDSECPGDLKCCTPMCTRTCTKPIPVAVKPGNCPITKAKCKTPLPKANCTSDSECPGDLKCCTPMCTRTCTKPLPVAVKPGDCPITKAKCKTPLPKGNCTSDSECPGDLKCCTPMCTRTCTKPIPVAVKPGDCPVPQTRCEAIQKGNCTSDSECPGDLKCCTPWCTRTCTKPTPAKVKPGECPVYNTLVAVNCSTPAPTPGCFNDQDCLEDKKCCKPLCDWTCTKPVLDKVKPGKCPVVMTFAPCTTPAPMAKCKSDQECTGDMKCCLYGCQIMCAKPVITKS